MASHLKIKVQHEPISLENTVLIGIQVLKLMKQLHEWGFVHGDLKLDNICVGNYNNKIIPNDRSLKLIDFGLTRPFIKEDRILETEWSDEDHVD